MMDLRIAALFVVSIVGCSAQTEPTCTSSGELFPYDADCQQFWFCNSELVPYLYTCAAGQYFDASLLSCNPEEQVDCGTRSTPTTTTTAAPTTSAGQIICTVSGELFPDATNCQDFWFCNTDLVPYVYTCAAGEYFDADALSCNPQETVSCGTRSTPTTAPTEATTASSGAPTCTASGELFPDSANCSGFWYCDTNLVPYLYYCANSEYYDETAKSCNPRETVACGTRSTGTTSSSGTPTTAGSRTPSPTQSCDYVSELLPDCGDCGAFFECDALLDPVYMECPAGEYFSIPANDCQDSDNVDCVDGARPDYDLCP